MNLKRKLLRREATRDVRHRDLVGIHAIYARVTAALLSILAFVALRVQIAAGYRRCIRTAHPHRGWIWVRWRRKGK